MKYLDILDKVEKKEIENEEIENFNHKKYLVDNYQEDKKIYDFFSGDLKKGLKTEIQTLDKYIVCKRNSLYASVGKKGRGKTTILQILKLMWSVCHSVKHLCLYKENEDWQTKITMLGYLFGESPKKVKEKDEVRFLRGLDWLNRHFIFQKATTKKNALMVAKKLITQGEDIFSLTLDPSNSIPNGFDSVGSSHEQSEYAAQKILDFSLNWCTVFVNQHPNMTGQRSKDDISSEDAEGGYFYNKAHFAWSINRDRADNTTRLRVESVRNKLTGGNVTSYDNPILLKWSPYCIDFSMKDSVIPEVDVFTYLVNKNLQHLELRK